jgi:ParB/RepB/Spo0J family partition protein
MNKNEQIRYVSPNDIAFNPDNPRGQDYEDKDFIALEESIRQFGVMVPLIVFKNDSKKGKKYILLDGERRLKAAQKVKREGVPIHVLAIKKAKAQGEGLKRMFQIHMLREQWEPMAQAQALKFYVDLIKRKNKSITDQDLIGEIAKITKMDGKKVEDRLRLLRFNKETQEKVMENKLDDSYLVQIEQNFVEQLEKNIPQTFKDHSREEIRGKLIAKAEKGLLGTTRAFFWIPDAIMTCKKLDKIEIFAASAKRFIENIEYTIEDLKNDLTKKVQIPTLTSKTTSRSLIKNINKLNSQLSEFDLKKETDKKRKEGILVSLKKLRDTIDQMINNK